MRKPVSDEVFVHYGQLYVVSEEDAYPDLRAAFRGQGVGLCGAAEEGMLFLTTGLHTGDVSFAVEVHEQRPEIDGDGGDGGDGGGGWEEVVEVSFTPVTTGSILMQWAGERCWELDLPVADYRVRYCAAGMDAGRAKDTRLDGEPVLDRYLLQFWPSPPEPPRLVRQASETAAYWHRFAEHVDA